MTMKKVLPWVLGGVITISALGLGVMSSVGSAAEQAQKPAQQQMYQAMLKDGKGMMDMESMQQMMSDTQMQKKCMEMMQQPEMQAMLKEMMQKPEMQTMMKEMMQKDGQFHKMMLDLVSSVEMTEVHDHELTAAVPMPATGHTEHHQ